MTRSWALQVLWLATIWFVGGHTRNSPAGSDLERTTSNGTVRGFAQMGGQTTIYTFLGVPYAAPPKGELRFQPPQPPQSWTGVKDATKFGYACHQSSGINTSEDPKDEDCLFVNIFTPARGNSSTLLPVMVWIHGGAFILGAGSLINGVPLATHDVVVITFNYRVNVLGFMSFEDDVIPGNYGMLDTIQLLKWVQENIEAFGGDPARVTLFGQSAGACATSLQIMSPLSRGLFQFAIMESGSSLTTWAMVHPSRTVTARRSAELIGEIVGCTSNDSNEFLACMQSVDPAVLTEASDQVNFALGGTIALMPRVDNANGFLPELPLRIQERGDFNHVNTIRGFNTHEESCLKQFPWDGASREDFYNNLMDDLSQLSFAEKMKIVDELEDYYIGNSTDPLFILQKMVSASTDLNFFGPILNEIKMFTTMAPEKKHYLYQFGHRPSFSPEPTWVTTSHGEEVPFVFETETLYHAPFDEDDHYMSEQIMTMWSNFARTGDPTATFSSDDDKWEPFAIPDFNLFYLDLDPQMTNFSKPEISDMYLAILQKIDI